MAYSNITPPTLPEYDSALYSNYVLEFEYENGLDNWFAVSLRYSSTPFTYDGSAVTNAGEHHLQTYGSGTGEWTYWGTLTEMAIAPGKTATGGYRRIWTNHDILDGSGNIWLAANTATPAEANLDRLSIMKSKLAGLIMAWCAPVRQFPQPEPVAYLYNGVRLPKLPEWDKTAYPYAVIGKKGTTVFEPWRLYCFSAEVVTLGNVAGSYALVGSEYYLFYSYTDSVWSGGNESQADKKTVMSSKPIWCNFDLYKSDDTLFLAASEPIPVYE